MPPVGPWFLADHLGLTLRLVERPIPAMDHLQEVPDVTIPFVGEFPESMVNAIANPWILVLGRILQSRDHPFGFAAGAPKRGCGGLPRCRVFMGERSKQQFERFFGKVAEFLKIDVCNNGAADLRVGIGKSLGEQRGAGLFLGL